VTPGNWDVLGSKHHDPVNWAALGTDCPDVGADLGGQIISLKGAGECNNAVGHKRKEADCKGQFLTQVGVERFEVAALIATSGDWSVAGITLLAIRRLAIWRHRCSKSW
jgi:hypothetical protein